MPFMAMDRKQRFRLMIFLTIFLVVIYTINFTFTVWALNVKEEQNNMIGVNPELKNIVKEQDIPSTYDELEVYSHNFTETSENDNLHGLVFPTDIMGQMLFVGSFLTFQHFLTLGTIGLVLTIFFNLLNILVLFTLIVFLSSIAHDWIPLLH